MCPRVTRTWRGTCSDSYKIIYSVPVGVHCGVCVLRDDILAQLHSCIYKTVRTALSFPVSCSPAGGQSGTNVHRQSGSYCTWHIRCFCILYSPDNNKFDLRCKFWSVQGRCQHYRLIMARVWEIVVKYICLCQNANMALAVDISIEVRLLSFMPTILIKTLIDVRVNYYYLFFCIVV